MLDNRYALLFIRGERPVKDFKFDIMKHPNVSLTEDGKGCPYIHGDTSGAAFTIELTNQPLPEDDAKAVETGYTLLSEEDVEKLFSDNSEQVQILLGLGIMQVGLSLKSHNPSQRANGFLTLAGGIIITFT